MQIRDLLSKRRLPKAETEILLATLLKRERTWIISHLEYTLSETEESQWKEWEQRRWAKEPIAYIIGRKEFYGREFIVDRRSLIPRPSTEGLIELALDFIASLSRKVREIDSDIAAISLPFQRTRTNAGCIVDIGTGSGCIAITLALERPHFHIIATDASAEALALARENAKLHKVEQRIIFKEGTVLLPLSDIDVPYIIVSNPPYIKADTKLSREVAEFEPHAALFAGEDGLTVIRPLVEQAKRDPYCVGIILECGMEQVDTVERLASEQEAKAN